MSGPHLADVARNKSLWPVAPQEPAARLRSYGPLTASCKGRIVRPRKMSTRDLAEGAGCSPLSSAKAASGKFTSPGSCVAAGADEDQRRAFCGGKQKSRTNALTGPDLFGDGYGEGARPLRSFCPVYRVFTGRVAKTAGMRSGGVMKKTDIRKYFHMPGAPAAS